VPAQRREVGPAWRRRYESVSASMTPGRQNGESRCWGCRTLAALAADAQPCSDDRVTSQTPPLARSCRVKARTATRVVDHTDDPTERLNLMFRAHHARIARVIGRVIRDQARAEELADVFLKWWRTASAHGDHAEGWLVRTGVRLALDELRRVNRRRRLDHVLHLMRLARRHLTSVQLTQRPRPHADRAGGDASSSRRAAAPAPA
jgi:hypothetical protein